MQQVSDYMAAATRAAVFRDVNGRFFIRDKRQICFASNELLVLDSGTRITAEEARGRVNVLSDDRFDFSDIVNDLLGNQKTGSQVHPSHP